MTVNNKIKFLLSTLIILGGYVTGSNCYCSDRPNKKGNYDMSTNTFQLSNTDTQAKISKYVINLIDLFEREPWNIANNLKLPPLSHSLSLSKLREKYPAIINITSTKDNITILTFEKLFRNKLYQLNAEYVTNITNYCIQYSKNIEELETKIRQETINYYKIIKQIIDWLAIFLKNDLKLPEQDTYYYIKNITSNVKNMDGLIAVCMDKNVIIEDKKDFKNDEYYVSKLFALPELEVNSENKLSTLIQDKEFLKFVNGSYQAFSDLNMKIKKIIDIDNDRLRYYVMLSPELVEKINKLFPNNILDEMDFHYVIQILRYCSNKISQLGTLQLYNTIQQCINEYKKNNDEDKLKLEIKHQIIKIYHQNVIPTKEILNKLLQEFVNKYNGDNLSDKEREKLLKLKRIIPQLGSELETFAAKYNIPSSDELIEKNNKIEQNRIENYNK